MANRFVKQIFKNVPNHYSSVQFSSVTQSCPNLCNPMDCSTPGFSVLQYLLEFAQTHVHWVSDTIQPSHPLEHQSIFQWIDFASGGQSIGASASSSFLPMNIQDWFPLGLTDFISLLSMGLSRVFSSTAVQKHQFFSTQPYGPTLTSIHDHRKNHSLD